MLFVFAVLPLGLFSFINWRESHRRTAGAAFLAALAPLVLSGVRAAANAIGNRNRARAQQSNEELAAQTAEKQRKQAYAAQQASPETQMQQLQYRMRLGRLAGRMGGLDKVPPAIAAAMRAGMTSPAFQEGPAYRPQQTGSSAWDYVQPAMDVAASVDWEGVGNSLRRPKAPASTPVNATSSDVESNLRSWGGY